MCIELSGPLDSPGAVAAARAEAGARASLAGALAEKWAKSRLAVAADHFNRDYRKGFQFLQAR